MREQQLGEAMDMVVREFKKIQSAKLSQFRLDFNEACSLQRESYKALPKYSLKKRGSLFTKNRKKLLGILKPMESSGLARVDSFRKARVHTYESTALYIKACESLFTHPELANVKIYNESLDESITLAKELRDARMAEVNADTKSFQMSFLVGETPFTELESKLSQFEAKEY
jgi:hypothetical protein